MQTIEIVIAPNGATRVETKGFTGAGCRDASRLLEQALGQVTSEQTTVEFHQGTVPTNFHQQQEH